MGAITVTDKQKSSVAPQKFVAMIQCHIDAVRLTECISPTGSHGDETENKNCDAYLISTYCSLYVVLPGKKKSKIRRSTRTRDPVFI